MGVYFGLFLGGFGPFLHPWDVLEVWGSNGRSDGVIWGL